MEAIPVDKIGVAGIFIILVLKAVFEFVRSLNGKNGRLRCQVSASEVNRLVSASAEILAVLTALAEAMRNSHQLAESACRLAQTIAMETHDLVRWHDGTGERIIENQEKLTEQLRKIEQQVCRRET